MLRQRWAAPGEVPVERYLEAIRHIRTMRRYSLRESRFVEEAPGVPSAAFGSWESLGPGNVGGRTRALVIHPQNASIMWAGGATGGVWKTTDGGQTWTPLTDFAPVLTLNSLVIDPNDSDTLYAGTGEQTQGWRGAGIFKTSDGGQTWSQLPGTATSDFYYINKLAVSPRASSRLYAATATGLWTTADGAVWSRTLATGGSGCFDLALQPGQAADVLLAVCQPPGTSLYAIFRNPDAAGAGKWVQVQSAPHMGATALAIAPSLPSTVYAVSIASDSASPYNGALLAVYRSQSNGEAGSWETRVSNQDPDRLNTAILSSDPAYSLSSFCADGSPSFGGQGSYNIFAAVDPLDADRLWAGGIGLFRSDDGGATWGSAFSGASSFNGNHPDQHFLAFHPGYDGGGNQILYNGNDGGIFQTSSARGTLATCASPRSTVTWASLNHGYGTTQFYYGVPYPGGGAYFGGTQDNGTVRGGDARGPNGWSLIYGGDGGVSRVDPIDANTIYVEYVHLALAKSTDGGFSYKVLAKGITEDPNHFPFIAFYTFDPNNSLRLYIGATQLWRTEDGANNWTAASAAIPAFNGNRDTISSIAVSPAGPNVVLFGTNHGRVYRNSNALAADGVTAWASAQLRTGNVSHLEIDPSHPATVYATFTTFKTTTGDNHIYRSTDSGATWTGIDGAGATGLPDVPVDTLLVDPDDSARLYAGTDLGVFASLDGGATWAHDDNPFANVITQNLVIDRSGGTKFLYAFTYGRGVFRVPLGGGGNPCAYAVSPASVALDPNGGTAAADVATSPGCAWSVMPVCSPAASRIAVQAPASGVGPAKAFFTAVANTTSQPRTGTFLVQGQSVTVTQAGFGTATSGPAPTASVTPAQTVLNAGGQQQFTAAISLANPAVRWTSSPAVGFISPTGLYTAPAQLDAPASVTVTATSLANPALFGTATVTVAPPPLSVASGGVVNAASFQQGPVAPGEIVTIFGSGIGPVAGAGAQLDAQGRLAALIAGTQVLFDRTPAPLAYVSAQQINAIVPYEVAGQKSTQMVVTRNGQSSPPIALPVAAASPAVILDSPGRAAVLNEDGLRNSPQVGAPRGTVVTLFGTGEGQTNPPGVTGSISGSDPPKPAAPLTVQIGGVNADILYAGSAPGEVAGLLQLNVRVPASVQPGPNAVVVKVGDAASPSNVTMTVLGPDGRTAAVGYRNTGTTPVQLTLYKPDAPATPIPLGTVAPGSPNTIFIFSSKPAGNDWWIHVNSSPLRVVSQVCPFNATGTVQFWSCIGTADTPFQ